MILQGTEKLRRYPHIPNDKQRGVPSYGTVKVPGYESQRCYKVGLSHYQAYAHDLVKAGWRCAGIGRGYAYYYFVGPG